MASRIVSNSLGLLLASAMANQGLPSHAAEFAWSERQDLRGGSTIVLVGDIAPGDTARLEEIIDAVNSAGSVVHSIRLYSRGGSLDEALSLGRTIRHYRLHTEAPIPFDDGLSATCIFDPAEWFTPSENSAESRDCACHSACALAWLGGLQRSGSVGLNRAYRAEATGTYDDREVGLSSYASAIQQYLDELRVPDFLLDPNLTTDSHGLSFFPEEDDGKLRMDPGFSAFVVSQCGPGPPTSDKRNHSDLFESKYFYNRLLEEADEATFQRLDASLRAHSECTFNSHRHLLLAVQTPHSD